MQFELHGRRVYAYTGTKPIVPEQRTVVFIHGAANDHSVWALQSRYFAYHRFNVLAVDLPGHGRSDGPPLATIEELAAWTFEVLDNASLERAVLIGHSMGSLIALDAAARHPARVSKLALVATAVPMAVSDALLDAAREHEPYVARETLATSVTYDGTAADPVTIEGKHLHIAVSRA